MKRSILLAISFVIFLFRLVANSAHADELRLPELIEEALKNSPGALKAEARWKTSTFKIPQAKSLPDPMFMFGYQNEGFRQFTYGKSDDAELMFSASQTFPFPGKLPLKGEMASKDADSQRGSYEVVRLKTIAQVKELYYSLFFCTGMLNSSKARAPSFREWKTLPLRDIHRACRRSRKY